MLIIWICLKNSLVRSGSFWSDSGTWLNLSTREASLASAWASCSGSRSAIRLDTDCATSVRDPPDWRGSDGTETKTKNIISKGRNIFRAYLDFQVLQCAVLIFSMLRAYLNRSVMMSPLHYLRLPSLLNYGHLYLILGWLVYSLSFVPSFFHFTKNTACHCKYVDSNSWLFGEFCETILNSLGNLFSFQIGSWFKLSTFEFFYGFSCVTRYYFYILIFYASYSKIFRFSISYFFYINLSIADLIRVN